MLKKILTLALLLSLQVKALQEQIPVNTEDLTIQSELPEESDSEIVRRKKCKRFCHIIANCAKICSLAVAGNATVGGNLTVAGNLAVTGEGAFGGPISTGECVLTCTDGGLVVATPAGTTTIGAGGGGVGILGYGYVYALTQAATVAIEGDVLFDSNGPLSGVTHTAGSASIQVVSAGTYAITFSVSGTEPNQFALTVNGVPNPSTIYGSGAGTQQNTGFTILTLGAGDTLTLRNHTSAAAVTLAPNVGGTQDNVRASVHILRIA